MNIVHPSGDEVLRGQAIGVVLRGVFSKPAAYHSSVIAVKTRLWPCWPCRDLRRGLSPLRLHGEWRVGGGRGLGVRGGLLSRVCLFHNASQLPSFRVRD
jgi:hypothetical protein